MCLRPHSTPVTSSGRRKMSRDLRPARGTPSGYIHGQATSRLLCTLPLKALIWTSTRLTRSPNRTCYNHSCRPSGYNWCILIKIYLPRGLSRFSGSPPTRAEGHIRHFGHPRQSVAEPSSNISSTAERHIAANKTIWDKRHHSAR